MKNRLTVKRSQGGFTLIELMVVIAIVAILLAVALPAYQNQMIRGHRAAAKSEMMEIANKQQQYLLANRAYATTVVDDNSMPEISYSLPDEVKAKYTLGITVDNTALPIYTLEFTPIGSQASDGKLSITSEGVKEPPEKWTR
jgi:type IV pilus assembly protein PilE